MQLKKAERTERDQLLDCIYAAMETGNHARARTLLTEYGDSQSEDAAVIRAKIVSEYGIAL